MVCMSALGELVVCLIEKKHILHRCGPFTVTQIAAMFQTQEIGKKWRSSSFQSNDTRAKPISTSLKLFRPATK